jgi:drug/metabolite transporter (DMT)-like permease
LETQLQTNSSLGRGILLLVLIALAWGSTFMFTKIAVVSVPPLTLAAGRVAVAALALFAYISLRGHRLPVLRAQWTSAGVLAVFLVVFPIALLSWAQQFIDTALAGILVASLPLITLALAHAFVADERLTIGRLFGVVFGFAGVIALIGPEALKGLGLQLVAQLALLGGPLSYAIGMIVARRVPPMAPSVRATSVSLVGCAILIPAALIVDRPWTLSPTPGAMASTVYLGLVPTAMAMILSFEVIATRGATFMSLTNYLVPCTAVSLGWLFLGETISAHMLGAMAVILGGIALATLTPSRPVRRAARPGPR